MELNPFRYTGADMRAQRLLIAFALVTLAVASTGTWAGGGEINLWYGEKNLDLKSQREIVESEFSDSSRTGSDTFGDLEDLTQFGLMTSWGLDWPVAIAADFFLASNDVSLAYTYDYNDRGSLYYRLTERIEVDYDTWEVDLGIRKYFGGNVQFFIGTGLAIGSAEIKVEGAEELIFNFPSRGEPQPESFSFSDSDTDFGLWADVGFVWRAGDHFNLGLDVRYSSINVDLQFDERPDNVPERFPVGGVQVGLFLGGRW
jgi:hypothetical protein